ncbi:MAG: CdaR family protein [Xanthomarina sp.]
MASVKNKKINVFLLFLLLSFVVLLVLKLSNTYTNTITFEINKIHIPEKNLVLNDHSQKLDITIRSQGFNLLKYYFKNPKINIDFNEHITKNKNFYVWNKHQGFSDLNQQFSKNEEIVSITPDTLKFRYDVNEIKKVPIKLQAKFQFNQGFDFLDSIRVDPDSIKIIGPKILVSKISFIETDSVWIKDIKSDISKVLNLKLPKNENGNLSFSQSQIAIYGKVDKFTEGHLKVPVSVINVPKNQTIKYFPKKIYVTYYTSLSNYNNIQVSDFKVVCDYNKLEKGSDFLIPELAQKPDKVKHIKLSHEHIEFIIIE